MKLAKFKRIRSRVVKVILVILLIYAFILPFTVIATLLPIFSSLEFNPYALLSLVGAATNLGLLIAMFRRKARSDEAVWIMMFIGSAFLFALFEIFVRTNTNFEAYNFWGYLYGFWGVMIASTSFLFALHYTQPESKHGRVTLLVIFGAVILGAFGATPAVYDITREGTVLLPWGFQPTAGDAFFAYGIWIYVLVGWTIGKLLRFRRRTANPTLKMQSLIYAIGFIVPMVASTIGDIGLPGLGYNFIPLTVLFFTVTGIILYIGLTRFHFFSFSPSLFSQQVLGTMNESVLITNNKFQIEFINEAATSLLRTGETDIRGKSIEVVFGDIATTRVKEHVNGDKKADALELEVAVASHTVPISLVSSEIVTEKTRHGNVLVFRDISKERAAKEEIEREVVKRTQELHEEQAKFRASIESLSVGFMLIDDNDELLIQNHVLQDIFDIDGSIKSSEQIQKKLVKTNFLAACHESQAQSKIMEISDVNLGNKILSLFIAPVIVNNRNKAEIIGSVILVEDVTEKKVMERSKDEFFSIASHELRTPLTSIKGNASMMLEFYKDAIAKDANLGDMVTDIHQSAVRLIDIVNDFLDLSRIEQGKVVLQTQEFPIGSVIESIAAEMQPVLKEKKVDLNYDKASVGKLPSAWGDPNRFRQVLYNLLGNAAKFTEKGSITVDASHEKDMIVIDIKDTGRGIALEMQSLLFHKFQQAGESLLTRDTTRGTGLGLYISKMLAEQMGGEVELVHSEADKGSTFRVTIPVATDKVKHEKQMKTETDTETGLQKGAPITDNKPTEEDE